MSDFETCKQWCGTGECQYSDPQRCKQLRKEVEKLLADAEKTYMQRHWCQTCNHKNCERCAPNPTGYALMGKSQPSSPPH